MSSIGRSENISRLRKRAHGFGCSKIAPRKITGKSMTRGSSAGNETIRRRKTKARQSRALTNICFDQFDRLINPIRSPNPISLPISSRVGG
jgi:hypothetical protein